jgi:hypothetical protein
VGCFNITIEAIKSPNGPHPSRFRVTPSPTQLRMRVGGRLNGYQAINPVNHSHQAAKATLAMVIGMPERAKSMKLNRAPEA